MKVREVMTETVQTCRPWDSLEQAAHLLWKHDCGALPVVDAGGRVQSMITDRDICMGALSRGQALTELRVADSMSPRLVTCRPEEELSAATDLMCEQQVRRLPVVDEEGLVRGILSLNDLATSKKLAGSSTKSKAAEPLSMKVLADVSRHGVIPPPERAATDPSTAKRRKVSHARSSAES